MEPEEPNEIEGPRSVPEIIGEALDIYQRYPLLFLVLALGVIAPYELMILAVTGDGPLVSSAHQNPGVTYLLLLLDTAAVGPLVSALHIHAVVVIGQGNHTAVEASGPARPASASRGGRGGGRLRAGDRPRLRCLDRSRDPARAAWSVVAQVAAVDHEGWIPALRRSRELTRERYGHIFGLLLITGLLNSGVLLGVRVIPLGSTAGAASVAVGMAARTITASFSVLTLALLYFDLERG